MTTKIPKLLALVAATSLILTACLPSTLVDEETIKVGAVLPLTGDAASYGIPMQKVAQIAIDEVNAAGGINGKNLEFIWEDGKCDGKAAATAAQKLINVDGVEIIYGGFCSGETLGLAPLAEAAGVVALSCASSSPDVTGAGDYIFRNYPSDSAQGRIMGNLIADQEVTKLAILTEEQDYTIGIESVLASTAEERDVKVVKESFLSTDSDFKTQLAKLKNSGADGLFINPQTGPKGDLILKQLQEQNWDVKLFGNDVMMSSSDVLANYLELVEGMMGAETGYNTENEGFKHFTSTYMEQEGVEEVPYLTYTSTCYDAVEIIAEGVAEVGNEADAFKAWLYKIKDREGAAGSLTLDQNGEPGAGHRAKVINAEGKSELYLAQ